MSRKSKRHLKKTPHEAQNYRISLKSYRLLPEETLPINNEFLTGTGEMSFDEIEETKSEGKTVKKPIRYIVFDWLKAHVFDSILVTIIVAIGSFAIKGTTEIALLKQKVEIIDSQIEAIQESNVQKEVLDLELKNIKSDLNDSFLIPLNNIKWRVKILEKKIEEISE